MTVVNLPLTNESSYVAQLRRADANLAGLLEGAPEQGLLEGPAAEDSAVKIAVEPGAGLGLPAGAAVPDSVTFV